MKTKLGLFAAPVLVLLLAQPAAGADLQAAFDVFSAAHPGASFALDESGANRAFIVRGFRSAPLTGDRAEAARAFALENGAVLGLASDGADLVFDKAAAHRGKRFYHFTQTIHGLPVFNARVIVGVDESGRVYRLSSKAVTSAAPPAKPALDALDAELAAAGDSGTLGPAYDVQLGWFAVMDVPRLVWRVVAPAPGPHLFAIFVDARTGSVVFVNDLFRDVVQANVYLENPTIDGDTTVVGLENIAWDVEASDAGVTDTDLSARGTYAHAATCTGMDDWGMSCAEWEAAAQANENDFLDITSSVDTPTASPDPFAEVSAYYYVDQINRWFRDTFGYDALYKDMNDPEVENTSLWTMVNLNVANAFWAQGFDFGEGSGDAICTGQGSNGTAVIDFSYDADVLYHEFTHSVSTKAFNVGGGAIDIYGFDSTSGGVEEGNADYFSCTHAGNSNLGEYSLGALSGRDADNEDTCPGSLVGESHYDSVIVSGTMWEIREAIGATKTDHLNYLAMTSATIDTMGDFAAAVSAAATDMMEETGDLQMSSADVDTVNAVLEARGVVACERFVDMWVDGASLNKLSFTTYDITAGEGGTPSAVQYRITTGDAPDWLRLNLVAAAPGSYTGVAGVLMRVGAPVEFTWTEEGSGWQTTYTWTAVSDRQWTGVSASAPPTDVEVSTETDIVIQPNTEYYFSVLCISADYNGCANYVTADMEEGAVEEDAGTDADTDADTDTDTDADADAGTGGDDDDGCGCAAVGTAARATGLLGILF